MRLSTLLGLFLILTDLLSKAWVQLNLPMMGTVSTSYPYGGIGVFQDFIGIQLAIVYAWNTGAAWGIFANFQNLLLVLRVFLIIGLIVYLTLFNEKNSRKWPLTLIIAGATGNVLDYFIYGHVVDMFYFRFWGYSYPVFNVADIAICLGFLWLIIDLQLVASKEQYAL